MFLYSRLIAISFVVTAVLVPAVNAQSLAADDARPLLAGLCKAHPGEPVCMAQSVLAEDEAWLILRTACRTDKTDACKTFQSEQGVSLVFNARNKEWQAFWENGRLTLTFDVAGVPTLRLKPRDARPLKILVTGISPLTYSAKAGVPKEEDLAVVAGLKTILGLVGTGIQAVIQSATFSAAAGPPAGVPGPAVLTDTGKPTPSGGQRQACTSIKGPDLEPLASTVLERNQMLVNVNERAQGLARELDALEVAKAQFFRTMQKAEDNTRVTRQEITPAPIEALGVAYGELENASNRLTTETNLLTACQPLLSTYASLLGWTHDGDVLKALVAQVNAAESSCRVDKLREGIKENVTRVAPDCTPSPGQLETALKLHNTVMTPYVTRLANARQVEATVWQALENARGAKSQVLSAASTLNRQVQRGALHTWNGMLIPELVVTRPNPELPWNKVQTHSVIVKADSPYAKEVSLAYAAEETFNYKLESATGRILGYGVGVIYTPLHESTWTAATVPGTSTKVIAETKRETRAGDLAAFLTYRFMEHRPAKRGVQPILDFGVGLTSDRPAFFLGTGVEVSRAARIGFGWAPQRVWKLADGQQVNETIVTNTEEIRTERRFDTRNWYVSFSFALDSLSLFNRP
jgi:hypothetical protein